MQYRFASLIVFSALAACSNNAVIVELQTGDQMFDVAASSLGLPMSLEDTSSGSPRVASIDCSMSMCPSTMSVPIQCNAGLCDPAPIAISIPVGGVVDFQMILQSAGTLLRFLDGIEIESVSYDVDPNSLTVALPPTTILWGPASATETSATLMPIGTIPMIAAATRTMGMMDIDATGSAALGDYIVHTAEQVRFFARTSVDLNPGDPFPDGMAHITVNVRVRAIGRLYN
jgi:hypothetical protein